MLIVTDLQGNIEPLVDVQGVEVEEEINGDFSLSFTAFETENNEHAYPLLLEESIVELDGHEFRVKDLEETRNRKSVSAMHIFFDLIGYRKEDTFGGTRRADEIFNWLLTGTGWTYEVVGTIPAALLPNFGNDNILALIRSACSLFKCEIKIEPNKHIRVQQMIGDDKDEQFRFGHNIKTLKRSVETKNLATAIKGYGAEGLVMTYRSPNISKFGEIWADPVSDDRIAIPETMQERLLEELQDEPEIDFDIDAVTLGMDVGLGDRIWTIYEPMDIELQLRVFSRKTYPFTNKPPVITMSNSHNGQTDILTKTIIDIDENKKQVQSKFEQVNDRITMEVEEVNGSIARLELKADNIELSVNNRITNEVAALNVRADGILAEVSRVESETDSAVARLDIRADSITSTVNSVSNRLGNAESLISQTAREVSSKVSITDFNGNTISSLINQNAYGVKIQAQRIELAGLVTTNDITVGNSIRLGNANWGTKSMIFNDSTYITGVGGRMEFAAPVGGLNFMDYTSFHRDLDASHATRVVGLARTRSDQSCSVSFTSTGGMTWTVNGQSFYFRPD